MNQRTFCSARYAAKNMHDLRYSNRAGIQYIGEQYDKEMNAKQITKNLLRLFQGQTNAFGQSISLYEHGLQTATRALRAGEDNEYVVCSLLHDMGEDLCSPSGHGEVVAAMLRPYISQKNWWILYNHEIFQAYYYLHHLDMDRNRRDIFRDHPWFDATAKFCEDYDAPAFDPSYKNEPIETFIPMIEFLVSRPRFWNYVDDPKKGLISGSETGYSIEEGNQKIKETKVKIKVSKKSIRYFAEDCKVAINEQVAQKRGEN